MNLYSYSGPVSRYGKDIGMFKGETIAENERKAKSNLLFQCKKQLGLLPNANIVLEGKIKKVGEV